MVQWKGVTGDQMAAPNPRSVAASWASILPCQPGPVEPVPFSQKKEKRKTHLERAWEHQNTNLVGDGGEGCSVGFVKHRDRIS